MKQQPVAIQRHRASPTGASAPLYFPMQKVENAIISNIHASSKKTLTSGDTLETQIVHVPLYSRLVGFRSKSPVAHRWPPGDAGPPALVDGSQGAAGLALGMKPSPGFLRAE